MEKYYVLERFSLMKSSDFICNRQYDGKAQGY